MLSFRAVTPFQQQQIFHLSVFFPLWILKQEACRTMLPTVFTQLSLSETPHKVLEVVWSRNGGFRLPQSSGYLTQNEILSLEKQCSRAPVDHILGSQRTAPVKLFLCLIYCVGKINFISYLVHGNALTAVPPWESCLKNENGQDIISSKLIPTRRGKVFF